MKYLILLYNNTLFYASQISFLRAVSDWLSAIGKMLTAIGKMLTDFREKSRGGRDQK